MERCIVIGASHGGSQVIASLRQQGWEGEILLIGDEPHLPYHRPPLSKTFLAEDKAIEDILIRPAQAYEKADVRFHPNTRVASIDASEHSVTLEDGTVIEASHLVMATGSLPRHLPVPGADLAGVHVLRNAADVQAIKARAEAGRNAVIIGGGYIGLETAASLRKLGMSVTLLEAEDRVLARVTGPEMSSFYQRIHAEEGVEIMTGAMASEIHGDGEVSGVVLRDGRSVPADLVIVGVGITPATALAEAAGIEVEDGVVVDENCQTSAPGVYAVGDCARHFNSFYERSLRLESIQNAMDQAKTAAAAICGKPAPKPVIPWFWSDQYDIKLQIAGLSQGFDQIAIRGSLEEGRSFAAFYYKDGKLLACDAVNRPKEFMLVKKTLSEGKSIDAERAVDESIDVTELVPA